MDVRMQHLYIGSFKLDFFSPSLEHNAAPRPPLMATKVTRRELADSIPPLSNGRDLVQAGERSY